MTCTLCGLDSGDQGFCCAGCENVYRILVESGVLASGQDFRETDVYRQSLELGLISRGKAAGTPPIPANAETREAVYQLSGMWCASCGWLIEHALARMRGITSAEVVFASDLLKLRYCPQYVPPERVVERIASLGYRASPYKGLTDAGHRERQDLLLRLGVAAFLWMNVMVFSLVVYASYFENITGFGRYIPYVLMGLATPAVFYCAAPVLRIAWMGVRAGVLRMESLLAMGILTAYGYSVARTLAGSTHVYFDTVCAIVTLVLTGKAIEREAKQRAARAITLLHRLMPNKARVIANGQERFVSIDAVRPGVVFRVKSGERAPADGVVVEGRSHADESVLTGESAPRPKGPGDTVVSGSINVGGVLEVRATRAGAESALARIARAVEQASASRTRVERAVDRAARVFIPAVLLVAVLTFAGWTWRTGNAAEALLRGISVLVIACPCALGIATPLALTAAVAGASRRGILVSDTRVLETIRGVDAVVLDKTGTVTAGEFSLLEVTGDRSRMAQLAAVESRSEHPLGRAVVNYVGRGSELIARDFRIHPGMGVTGEVDGTVYFVGNRRLAEIPDGQRGAESRVSFGWDGEVKGTLRFGDRIRPEAATLCAELRRRGIRTILLSGDSPTATGAAALEIGVDEWVPEATPEGKIETIRRLQERGAVAAMIGDGVNDAPALAQADLGIALGCGADIAIEAAPLVLMNNSPAGVIDVLNLADRAFRVVRQNLFWAFVYNSAGISLAVAGILNPILAAGAMVLSSLSVIGNSRRLQ